MGRIAEDLKVLMKLQLHCRQIELVQHSLGVLCYSDYRFDCLIDQFYSISIRYQYFMHQELISKGCEPKHLYQE